MTALERFLEYLKTVERRLRWQALTRGAAICAAAMLLATLALSLWADRAAFSESFLFWARLALFLVTGTCVVLAVVIPLLRVNRRRAARVAESNSPEFAQRALTLSDEGLSSPFAELVAAEALERAEAAPPASLVRSAGLAAFGAAGFCGFAVLAWLTMSGPGSIGYGAHLLWAGAPPAGQGPIYQIHVKPGDARVRRGGDQVIDAVLSGYEPSEVKVRARKSGEAQWQSMRMEARPGGGGYAFLFAGVMQDLEYQVEAGRLKSAIHRLSVVDMPGVKKIRVVYHYPAQLGLKDVTEDPGGDVRAVEGTEAEILVQTDRALRGGALVLDDGSTARLEPQEGLWYRARLTVRKDGAYYVAGLDGGTPIRLSEDYFIESRAENAPTIQDRKARP